MHKAAWITDTELLSLLVDKFKSIILSKDWLGNTPLHYAAWYRNKNFIDILIKNGASVKDTNNDGNTPLHMACAGNNPSEDHSPKVEELLLDHKSNINALNNQKQTPIMLLFKSESEDEDIKKTSKFDPISTLMVLLKHKPR